MAMAMTKMMRIHTHTHPIGMMKVNMSMKVIKRLRRVESIVVVIHSIDIDTITRVIVRISICIPFAAMMSVVSLFTAWIGRG